MELTRELSKKFIKLMGADPVEFEAIAIHESNTNNDMFYEVIDYLSDYYRIHSPISLQIKQRYMFKVSFEVFIYMEHNNITPETFAFYDEFCYQESNYNKFFENLNKALFYYTEKGYKPNYDIKQIISFLRDICY